MGMLEFSSFSLPELPEIEGRGWRRIMNSVAALMLRQRDEVFASQGKGMVPAWAPLAPSTMARRLAKVKPGLRSRVNAVMLLQDTGKLKNSFSSQSGAGVGPGGELHVQETSALIETHVEYAAIQNFGGSVRVPETKNGFGRGVTIPAHVVTIPARPFDQFRPKDEDEIAELITGEMARG